MNERNSAPRGDIARVRVRDSNVYGFLLGAVYAGLGRPCDMRSLGSRPPHATAFFDVERTMTASVLIRAGNDPELEAFLSERIYEYNAAATGYFDAEAYTAAVRNPADGIEGGIAGFTWGGCCFVSYLWVAAASRGMGLGRALLGAVEQHATRRRCRVVLLSSHSFQAPGFYERMGYTQLASISDYPVGHSDIVLSKRICPPHG